MRVAGIEPESVVDGEGYRYVVFLQGCPHHCEGCHNPQTWDFNGGTEMSVKRIISDMEKSPLVTGLTISGGEPFMQEEAVLEMVSLAKIMHYDVWVYTGFTIEELLSRGNLCVWYILSKIDMLVDGRFDLSQKDLSLSFRGSRNQRLITREELNKIMFGGNGYKNKYMEW